MQAKPLRRAATIACIATLLWSGAVRPEQIPVRHIEGITLGFLVLRTAEGNAVAYGDLKQVIEGTHVRSDMTFRFRDGSFYQEDVIYTQEREFHLWADHVVQRGPAFKQELESWIDVKSGDVKVVYNDKGKQKQVQKRLEIPPDVANGIILILLKNIDPGAAKTTVSMVIASSRPRLVKLNVFPEAETIATVGFNKYKAQHYRIHVEIGGVAGVVAPMVGKQPPDLEAWLVKSEAPSFLAFLGPLESQGSVWRMELAAPEPDNPRPAKSEN